MSEEATSAADISLAADFDTPTQADWEREVLKVLEPQTTRRQGAHD